MSHVEKPKVNACDCVWDYVPLRGPSPKCSDCLGTGSIPPTLKFCQGCNKETPHCVDDCVNCKPNTCRPNG